MAATGMVVTGTILHRHLLEPMVTGPLPPGQGEHLQDILGHLRHLHQELRGREVMEATPGGACRPHPGEELHLPHLGVQDQFLLLP